MHQARSRAASPVGTTLPLLVRSAHLGPALAVTLIASLLAVRAEVPPVRLGALVAAVLAGQLTIGWSNDLLDRARDRATGRSDKPLADGRVAGRPVVLACAVALLACVPLSLAAGLPAGLLHLAAVVGGGWAYNLGLKSTGWSWLPYAVAFGALPVVAGLAGPDGLPAAWVPPTGALLGVAAHLLNALPDLDDDRATGVRGLPHRLGARAVPPVAATVLAAATLLIVGSSPDLRGPAGVLVLVTVAALCVVAVRAHGRTPFRAAVGVAVLDVLTLAVGR